MGTWSLVLSRKVFLSAIMAYTDLFLNGFQSGDFEFQQVFIKVFYNLRLDYIEKMIPVFQSICLSNFNSFVEMTFNMRC